MGIWKRLAGVHASGTTRNRLFAATVATVTAAASLAFVAEPAQAATVWPSHSSYTYASDGWSEAYYCIGCALYYSTSNGSPVWMRCWKDQGGHRWFLVTESGGASGYMRAGYVFNQASTPHCDA